MGSSDGIWERFNLLCMHRESFGKWDWTPSPQIPSALGSEQLAALPVSCPVLQAAVQWLCSGMDQTLCLGFPHCNTITITKSSPKTCERKFCNQCKCLDMTHISEIQFTAPREQNRTLSRGKIKHCKIWVVSQGWFSTFTWVLYSSECRRATQVPCRDQTRHCKQLSQFFRCA